MTEADDLIKAHKEVDELVAELPKKDDFMDAYLQEELADLCHRQWAYWTAYLLSKCQEVFYGHDAKGGLFIPKEFVAFS